MREEQKKKTSWIKSIQDTKSKRWTKNQWLYMTSGPPSIFQNTQEIQLPVYLHAAWPIISSQMFFEKKNHIKAIHAGPCVEVCLKLQVLPSHRKKFSWAKRGIHLCTENFQVSARIRRVLKSVGNLHVFFAKTRVLSFHTNMNPMLQIAGFSVQASVAISDPLTGRLIGIASPEHQDSYGQVPKKGLPRNGS